MRKIIIITGLAMAACFYALISGTVAIAQTDEMHAPAHHEPAPAATDEEHSGDSI